MLVSKQTQLSLSRCKRSHRISKRRLRPPFLLLSFTNMAQKSVRERLAFTMLILIDVFENEPINLSREDLANFVGTATETLIRLLKDFKEEGIIEVRTRKIHVLDRQRLLHIAGK